MTLDIMPLAYNCSRPFWNRLAEGVTDPNAIMQWVMCPFTITGIGLQGFGFFLILTVSVGLKNWSESFVVPVTWIVLASGVMVTMIPAPLVNRLFGLIVAGIGLLFIGLIVYFR